MYKKLAITTLTVLGIQISTPTLAAGPAWSYGEDNGPAKWGDLSPDYATCKNGKNQSPIDIDSSKTVKSDLPALKFSYQPIPLVIQDNGNTVIVPSDKAGTLTLGSDTYKLASFHYHSPSDETIDGKHADLVIHLAHKNAKGQSAGVAVMLNAADGATDPSAVDAIVKNLPEKAGEPQKKEGVTLDISSLLPKDLNYYSYDGSLTWPPCTEGVKWIVLKTSVAISKEAVEKLGKQHPNSNRPVQPLGDRKVLSSN